MSSNSNPWNGHKAAVSLTFDDGLDVQLNYAIPELDRRGIKATFFLIAGQVLQSSRLKDWHTVLAAGHEIGSHSVDHLKIADIDHIRISKEVHESKEMLEAEFKTPIVSYCYPYTHVNQFARMCAVASYQQARGGRVAREDKLIPLNSKPDLFNVPCYHIGSSVFENGELDGWLADLDKRSDLHPWLTLMFHGVGPDPTQWDNISSEQFSELLDRLQKLDVWITTFAGAGARFRRGHLG